MSYAVRARQLFPGDEFWMVCWADAPTEIEAVFEQREDADDYADALGKWKERKPQPGADTGRFLGGVLPFDAVLAVLDAIEPSDAVLLSMERQRLLAAQGRLAA